MNDDIFWTLEYLKNYEFIYTYKLKGQLHKVFKSFQKYDNEKQDQIINKQLKNGKIQYCNF